MTKWFLLPFLTALPAFAQTDAINGLCSQGGVVARTQGQNSTNYLNGVIPSCTVTVYITGTTNKATIYKDGLNTPLSNPFTATALGSVAPGQWLFYVADGQGVDIVLSGGIAPNTFAAPVTLTDVKVGGGGSGGGVSSINSSVGAITFTGPGVNQTGNVFNFPAGGGGSPGGVTANLQFNNGGTFGGSAAGANAAGDIFPRSLYGSLQTEFYRTGGTGNNGIINSLQSAQCPSTGCDVFTPGTSNSTEVLGDFYQTYGLIPNNTTQRDFRNGARFNLFNTNGLYVAGTITQPCGPNFTFPQCNDFYVKDFALSGGFNYYGTGIGFKSNFATGGFSHYYATAGQHNPNEGTINCFSWGDCVNGGLQMWVGSSAREPSDEKGHLGWLKIFEFPGVPVTTVTVGGTGTSTITLANINQGFGEERRLEDWKTYADSTTSNCYISGGGSQGKPLAWVSLAKYSGSGSCLPFADDAFMLATTPFPDTPTSHGAGLVTVTLQTSGFPTPDKPITWTTTTTGLPSTGLACVADYTTGQAIPDRMEQVNYTVVDATHISMTLVRPHVSQPVITIGPGCNRDFLAKANINGTVANIAGGGAVAQSIAIAGCQNNVCWLGNYAHTVDVYDSGAQSDGNSLVSFYQFNVASLSCASGTVTGTVTAASGNLDGVTFTLAGNDASFNGSFKVTATSAVDASSHAIFSYTDAGCVNGPSAALGTLTYDSRGYVIVPAAQILHIVNAATGHVDGGITLYPNNVAWVAGDTVVTPNDPSPDPSGAAVYVSRIQPNVGFTSQNDVGGLKVALQGNPGGAQSALTVGVDPNDITQYAGFGGQRSLPGNAALIYSGNYINAISIDPGTQAAILYRLNYWAKNKGVCDPRSVTNLGLMQYNTIGQTDSFGYDPCARQFKFTSNQAAYWFGQSAWQIGGNPGGAGLTPQLYGTTSGTGVTHFGTNIKVQMDNGSSFAMGGQTTMTLSSSNNNFAGGGGLFFTYNDNGTGVGGSTIPLHSCFWASAIPEICGGPTTYGTFATNITSGIWHWFTSVSDGGTYTNGLQVGLPQTYIIPSSFVFTGTLGANPAGVIYALTAVAPDGTQGGLMPWNGGEHSNTVQIPAAGTSASNFVTATCPVAIQGDHPAGTTYLLWRQNNNSPFNVGWAKIGACPIGGTAVDNNTSTSGSTTDAPLNENATGHAGNYIVSPSGGYGFAANNTPVSGVETTYGWITSSATGVFKFGTTKGATDGTVSAANVLVNGISVTPSGSITSLWGFGTSIMASTGATTLSNGAFSLLTGITGGVPAYNFGVASSTIEQDVLKEFVNYQPAYSGIQGVVVESGENNAACSSGGCIAHIKNQFSAYDAWPAIPPQNRILASAANTTTGTWADDSGTYPLFQPTLTASAGVAQKATTSGASKTFNIPSSSSTAIGILYGVQNANTGSFTVSIDGTNVTDNCSGTTTFSSAPCLTAAGADHTFYRQQYAVTPNTTHTVVVTSTTVNAIDFTGVDWIPASGASPVVHAAVLPNFTSYATINPLAQAVITQLSGAGLPIYYADMVGGTPGVNTTTDVSGTATTSCPATTTGGHPNDCGQLHYFQTLVNTLSASKVSFTNAAASSGKFVGNSGQITGPLNVASGGLTHYLNTTTSIPQTVSLYGGSSTATNIGFSLIQDASASLPWSGQFVEGAYSTFGWGCNGTYNNSGTTLSSNFTTKWCSDPNGNTFQLGATNTRAVIASGTKFTTSGCTVTASTGGSSAGTVTLGTNSCGLVVTPGITAPNGWTCQAHDRTAPTVLIGGESASTTTTATITIPAGAGATDVISFSCQAF